MDINTIEKFLKALGNKKRLQIVKFLKSENEANISKICQEIRISYKATANHLAKMKALDIIGARRSGYNVYYFLIKPSKSIAKEIISYL
ncbi:MAG: metalloregulator ArsR/SmtB family transcription factor [bacterium]